MKLVVTGVLGKGVSREGAKYRKARQEEMGSDEGIGVSGVDGGMFVSADFTDLRRLGLDGNGWFGGAEKRGLGSRLVGAEGPGTGFDRSFAVMTFAWGECEMGLFGCVPEGMYVLVTLVEAYEREHHPMAPPDPIDGIRFHLEQLAQDQRALIGVIGSRGRVHEVMNGDRGLVPSNDSPTQREVRYSGGNPDPARRGSARAAKRCSSSSRR